MRRYDEGATNCGIVIPEALPSGLSVGFSSRGVICELVPVVESAAEDDSCGGATSGTALGGTVDSLMLCPFIEDVATSTITGFLVFQRWQHDAECGESVIVGGESARWSGVMVLEVWRGTKLEVSVKQIKMGRIADPIPLNKALYSPFCSECGRLIYYRLFVFLRAEDMSYPKSVLYWLG